MKKIFLTAVLFLLFSFSVITSHAEETGIKISSLKQDNVSDEINLDAQILNPAVEQYATVLVYKKGTDYKDVKNIYLLDQIKPELNNDGTFSASLNLKGNTENGWYVARMGGSQIKSPVIAEFYYISSDSTDVLGDTDGNKRINTVDVINLLQYTAGINKSNFNPKNANVNSDEAINNHDVTFLLRALAGYTYEKDKIFP